jgi:hypothetical protein
MISIRKLAAVDMAAFGARVILAEYALGVVLPFILGLISLRYGLAGWPQTEVQAGVGAWLVSIAANYIPLFIYAFQIARAGTVRLEGQPELARVRRYSVQQVILLVPFLVVIVALAQEGRRRWKGP